MQIAGEKAPFVMFETRAVEDRAASEKNGQYTAQDVDFVLITPAGSKDQIERIVQEWFAQKAQDVKEGRFNGDWLRYYERLYGDWKAGKDLPVDGTPIRTWPVLSPAQRDNLLSMKVMTIEALATGNEEVIRRLGMGGRALKQQAIDWLASTKDHGHVNIEITNLRVKVDNLEGQNAELVKKNAALQIAVDALQSNSVSEPHPAPVADDFMADLQDAPAKPISSKFKPA